MRTTAAKIKAGRDLERLYTRHKRDVYRFVLRDVRDPNEAEDITQTAFLDAFRALRRGDEPERPQAWLLTIAQNAARRRYRRRAGLSEVELDTEFLAAPDREGPSAGDIRVALERLRPAQREALVLREIGGRSYIEIAATLDISVPAVETLLFRARRALRVELEDEAPRTRTRLLGGLLTWPAFGWEGYASILGWLSGRGASAKVAGAVSAAVLGTGVGIQQGLVHRSDTAEARAPASRIAEPAEAERSANRQALASPTPTARRETRTADRPRSRSKPKPIVVARTLKADTRADRLVAQTTERVAAGLNRVTAAVARETGKLQRQVEDVVASLEATPE